VSWADASLSGGRVFGTVASNPSTTRVKVKATVLRTVGPQSSLFELRLPPGMRVLSGGLAAVDRPLDDRRLFVPFRAFFDPTEGRPSIPIETYLRLMFPEVPLWTRLWPLAGCGRTPLSAQVPTRKPW
jgi:hypothetical protein